VNRAAPAPSSVGRARRSSGATPADAAWLGARGGPRSRSVAFSLLIAVTAAARLQTRPEANAGVGRGALRLDRRLVLGRDRWNNGRRRGSGRRAGDRSGWRRAHRSHRHLRIGADDRRRCGPQLQRRDGSLRHGERIGREEGNQEHDRECGGVKRRGRGERSPACHAHLPCGLEARSHCLDTAVRGRFRRRSRSWTRHPPRRIKPSDAAARPRTQVPFCSLTLGGNPWKSSGGTSGSRRARC
jgi:hypothetical protein